MKQLLFLVILVLSVEGILMFSGTSITNVTPDPVAGVTAEYTFTVTATDFTADSTDVVFSLGSTEKHTVKILKVASGTTATVSATFADAGEYTMKIGDTPMTKKVVCLATIIKSMTSTAKKDVAQTITLTPGNLLKIGTEVFQFSTAAPTSATSPAAAQCTAATDKSKTDCQVTLAEGNYTLYVNQKSSGLVLAVSSQYLKLAFGLLISFFLF